MCFRFEWFFFSYRAPVHVCTFIKTRIHIQNSLDFIACSYFGQNMTRIVPTKYIVSFFLFLPLAIKLHFNLLTANNEPFNMYISIRAGDIQFYNLMLLFIFFFTVHHQYHQHHTKRTRRFACWLIFFLWHFNYSNHKRGLWLNIAADRFVPVPCTCTARAGVKGKRGNFR